MLIFPISVSALLGPFWGGVIFFLIGAAFGATLEVAGFGDSRRLAAQFYLKNMTVLKTMFTGIIVASLLIFFSSAIGLMDFTLLDVNPTYLWPGIVGGLIMGLGFVIGGYCPGTSLVSAASLKLDGVMFFIGALIGVGILGETVGSFSHFWHSSYYGRYLLSDWLGWSVGAVLFSVVAMALVLFYLAEISEMAFKDLPPGTQRVVTWKFSRKQMILAATLLLMAGIVWAIGQPTPERKWNMLSERYEPLLKERSVFIHPLEYVKTWHNAGVRLETIDLRSKSDYNTFHLNGSDNATMDDILDPKFVSPLVSLTGQAVVVIVTDDEQVAIQAWKLLKAQGITNLFILEGGIHQWIEVFTGKAGHHGPIDLTRPPLYILDQFPKDVFETKIKLKLKKAGGGLCG
jgi:rhodanese-related sulfurtransferase